MRQGTHSDQLWSALQAQRGSLDGAGYVHVRHGIHSEWCALLREATRPLPYRTLEPRVGHVVQKGTIAVSPLAASTSALQELGMYMRGAVEPLVRSDLDPRAGLWPNEVAVLRMNASDGISLHRDQAQHEFLVASVTVTGTAVFTVERDRTTTLELSPGDVVVLLGGPTKRRPAHSVEALGAAERVSITFRYDRHLPPFHAPSVPGAEPCQNETLGMS